MIAFYRRTPILTLCKEHRGFSQDVVSILARASTARRRRISIGTTVNSAFRPELCRFPAQCALSQFDVCSTMPRLRAASEMS